MSFTVRTEDPGGGNPVHLAQLGPVGSLTYSWGWPRGPLVASFTLDLPVDASPVGLNPGRTVKIYDGPAKVWVGTLGDPQRGTPWTITAIGFAALGDRYVPVTSGGVATTNVNTAIDAAITRGLPWQRPTGLPTPTITQGAVATVNDLLDQVATSQGQRWMLDRDGHVVMAADPTVFSYLLTNVTTPGGRTIDNYATTIYGLYSTTATSPPSNALVNVSSQAATGNGPLGVYETTVDLTNLGPITGTVATQILSGLLTLVGPSAGFTGVTQVQPGQLLSPGGVPAQLSTVQAGQMVRCIGVEPDPMFGELFFDTTLDLVIAETDYDAAAEILTLIPVGHVPRDFSSLLESIERRQGVLQP